MDLQIHELGALFEEVQKGNIFPDGKTFPDCIPRRSLGLIREEYTRFRDSPAFDLKTFVFENFSVPAAHSSAFRSEPEKKSPREHINDLWIFLSRKPDNETSSLISLPYPYVVPGGRFREIYYWDSYFTMLGLRASGRFDLIQNMIDNFSWLIDRFGYIPNGNRTYFLGRSQPPFFSLMVRLLAENKGEKMLSKYLPQLVKEHAFWMQGTESLTAPGAVYRVVRLSDGSIVNRYWDENNTPRPEAYREDVELHHQSTQPPEELFRHVRAAAESGWDFSSRWFRDPKSFATIHTTDIVPIDLNCLLVHLEQTVSDAYKHNGNHSKASHYQELSVSRKNAIRKFCWTESNQFFMDYDFVAGAPTSALTLAAAFPLFFEVATPDQARAVENTLTEKFLRRGGLTTTLVHNGQQWDAPNGWAPLQWIAYKGLAQYGFDELAGKVRKCWANRNEETYRLTGKMTEKYDVWTEGEAGGGEYPNQDGFGWTNGVYLAMTEAG